MSTVEEVRTMLEEHLYAMEEQIDSLRSVLAILDGDGAKSLADSDGIKGANAAAADGAAAGVNGRAPARRASRGRAGRGKGNGNGAAHGPARRARSAELESLLAQTGGSGAVELARQTGTDPAEVLARIRELEQAARARRRAEQS